MNYYQEITLLQNPDINLFALWSKVYQQIHLGLVEMQDNKGQIPIGVSFPEYVSNEKFNLLGSKIRLFATQKSGLEVFGADKCLERLTDYVHCTRIRSVPENEKITGYAIYQREQPKTSPERLARRYARRHHVDYVTALSLYNKRIYQTTNLPFIRLKSLSNDNSFCLWVKKIPVDVHSSSTHFSTYGLSSVSSVPEF